MQEKSFHRAVVIVIVIAIIVVSAIGYCVYLVGNSLSTAEEKQHKEVIALRISNTPEELSDCKFFRVYDEFSNLYLHVVRCPNSATTATYRDRLSTRITTTGEQE